MTLDEEEAIEKTTEREQEQQQDSSSAATLERRYGSLRPAAVGLLAKVRKRRGLSPFFFKTQRVLSIAFQKRGMNVTLLKASSEESRNRKRAERHVSLFLSG